MKKVGKKLIPIRVLLLLNRSGAKQWAATHWPFNIILNLDNLNAGRKLDEK
jgi:hypothetical protein